MLACNNKINDFFWPSALNLAPNFYQKWIWVWYNLDGNLENIVSMTDFTCPSAISVYGSVLVSEPQTRTFHSRADCSADWATAVLRISLVLNASFILHVKSKHQRYPKLPYFLWNEEVKCQWKHDTNFPNISSVVCFSSNKISPTTENCF